jgi:hypothetical protein
MHSKIDYETGEKMKKRLADKQLVTSAISFNFR